MKMSIASASFLRAICVCLAVGLGSSWFLQLPAEGVELKRAGDNVTTNCAMAQRGSEPGFKDEPTSLSLDVIKKLREEMILIPSGEFLMGAVQNDASAQDDEKPRHLVKISKAFFIGVTEVTQSHFETVMGENPSRFKGADRPVERVTWDEAVEFCKRLSGKANETYRLPTEAEWEYACRAGTESVYFWGNTFDGDFAWYRANSDGQTHPVGLKKPNAWGLRDITGNVWEWCSDLYAEDYYSNSPESDPRGAIIGVRRVYRGGSWINSAGMHRASDRLRVTPDARDDNIGFRIVREVK